MSDEKRGVRHLTSRLLIPIALVVVVGIAQIMYAFRVLTEGGSTSWFLTITVVGVMLNMGSLFTQLVAACVEHGTGNWMPIPKHFFGTPDLSRCTADTSYGCRDLFHHEAPAISLNPLGQIANEARLSLFDTWSPCVIIS
jgi:hypothetical protein